MKTSLLLASSALFIASIQSFVINDNAATKTEPQVLKARDKVQQKPTEKRKISESDARQALGSVIGKLNSDSGSRCDDKSIGASDNIISEPRNFSNKNLTMVFVETRNK